MQRELLLELKEFLTERMVDNMSTKDLEEYVSNDLFNYFDKLGEHEFLEECRNYWDDSFDEVVEEVKDYMKCDFKKSSWPAVPILKLSIRWLHYHLVAL